MTPDLPTPTTDLATAKQDIDAWGYCMLKDALDPEQLGALRSRLFDQLEAERQRGISRRFPDGKQLVVFLLNKGQVFRDMIFHPGLHAVVEHVLGKEYLLSSYHAHFAHSGSKTAFHTDQFWMPPPTNEDKETLVKPGSVTRAGNRGHHVGGDALMQAKTIAPAVVCNAMWMLTDYTPDNGATLLVPGSHLSGRQPDHDLDGDAPWVPAVGPAGTVAIFEGRTWHSTGENRTDEPRIGLTTNFCAPQFRQQENYLLGTRPEVLESASPELLKLIGFKPWQGYGGYENGAEWKEPSAGEREGEPLAWIKRGVYALGELSPEEGTDDG